MLDWLKEKIHISEFEAIIKSFTLNQKIDFIDFAVCIVLADQKVASAEKIWLTNVCTMFGIDVNEYTNSNTFQKTIDDVISGIKTFNNDQIDLFLCSMVTGMASDGTICVEEEKLLDLVIKKLNLSEERVELAVNRINKMVFDYYQNKIIF